MKIENLKDLTQYVNRYETLKAQFAKANQKAKDDLEELLELHSFLENIAHKASKTTKPPSSETTDDQPKREYRSTNRAEIEHTKRLEKLTTLEQKEQAGTLTKEEKRRLKNFREAEKTYAQNQAHSNDPTKTQE
ncbi:hypothetical protein [Helicobacter suis]|uniref:hypothetical protein n=1 Tax=Helicobacter suis TaxID=104628 RepID=UPI001F3CF884|nr:hypothetical protein [Helicobacter suis]